MYIPHSNKFFLSFILMNLLFLYQVFMAYELYINKIEGGMLKRKKEVDETAANKK
ncbi:hypothetical protein CHCC20335_2440 [Bacillus paralicheniformis]|nr:hypothetical protein CHCC20335_2440 [Bacillus paralicheniformis]